MSELKLRQEHVSDFAFDQLLGAGAEPAERARVEDHLAGCVRCSLRYETLAGQRSGFLARMPSWHALREQQAQLRSRKLRPWLWGSGAALAASIALAFAVGPSAQPPGVRSKGGPSIGVYVKRDEHVARAEDGAVVHPGDYLRFTYSSDEAVHFALFNRDADRATTYYPISPRTQLVDAGRDVALDFSIKLDAAASAEHFYGLFCEQPQRIDALHAALQRTGQLPAVPGCRVDALWLRKQVK